jgi:hypothetical protein
MIKFTPNQSDYPRDELVRSGTLEDGPVLTVFGSVNTGREFRAMSVRLFFNQVDGVWACRYALVSGGLLKNDGTPGKVTGSREYSSPATSEDTPDWVRKVVRYMAPSEPAPSREVEPIALG